MQTLRPEALPAAHFVPEPVRHGHAPMHASHAVDQDRDAFPQRLPPRPPLERREGPVELSLVGCNSEEAPGDVGVQAREAVAEVWWGRRVVGQVEGEEGGEASLCGSVEEAVGDDVDAVAGVSFVAVAVS